MRLFLLTIFVAFFVSAPFSLGADEGFNEKEGQHVRVTQNEDGSRTIFKRMPGQRQMIKRMYCPNGKLISLTVYINDVFGNLRSCKIYDGKMKELFKVVYGYDKQGRLVREKMFESATNEEVRIFVYEYDANGEPKKNPLCFVKKKIADDKLINNPSAYKKDPFADDPEKALPGKSVKGAK